MQLGIKKLEGQAQGLQTGMLYWICAGSAKDAVTIALNALKNSEMQYTKYLITDGIAPDEIAEMVDNDTLLDDDSVNLYTTRGRNRVLERLLNDLQIIRADRRDSLIIAVIRDSFIYSEKTAENLQAVNELVNLARITGICLLLIPYGPHLDDLCIRLNKNSGIFGGLASITGHATDTGLRHYRIFTWNFNKVNSIGSTVLHYCNGGYSNECETFSTVQTGNDRKQIYVVGNDFAPSKSTYSTVYSLKSNREIYERAIESATAASLVFSLRNYQEINEISKYIYELRVNRGVWLQIFIREIATNIRASAEQFLLSCGATFIFEYGAAPSYINAMIEHFINMPYGRIMKHDYAELLERYNNLSYDKEGYLPVNQFVDNTATFLSRQYIGKDTRATLLILECRPAIPAEIAVIEFFPKRNGDVCTIIRKNQDRQETDTSAEHLNDCLAVLLPACREDNIATALGHIFGIDVGKLFQRYIIKTDDREILELIKNWKNEVNEDLINSQMIEFSLERQRSLREYVKNNSLEALQIRDSITAEPFDLNQLRTAGTPSETAEVK